MNNPNKKSLIKIKPTIISFIGMMGSGKTKIGKNISQNLNYSFYDVDNIIEKKFKMKTSKIFEKYGEKIFRFEEKSTILKKIKKIHLQKKNSIISLGGGGFENIETRKLLLNKSYVIWLDCPLEVLVKRVGNAKNRPMLKGNIVKSLTKLLQKRKKNYDKAHLKFDTSQLTYEQIIINIKENFNV